MSYKIVCTMCSSAVYEGETSLCLYERGKKHLSEYSSSVQSNCMVIHNKKFHPESTCLNFRMEGLRQIYRPIDRQIDDPHKEFWRQPAVPRASFSAPGLEKRTVGNKSM